MAKLDRIDPFDSRATLTTKGGPVTYPVRVRGTS